MQIRTAVCCAAVALVLSTPRACQFGKSGEAAYGQIGLGADQQRTLEQYRNELKTFRVGLDTKVLAVRVRINQELLKKDTAPKALAALLKEQSQLRDSAAQKRYEYLLKAKKVVTAEQFAKLVEMDWGCRCSGADAGAKAGAETDD